MALKFKIGLIAAGIGALGLLVYFVTGAIGDRAILKAKQQIEQLKGEVSTLTAKKEAVEKESQAKETEYQRKILALNGRLAQLQREKNGIESELATLKKQRESIVIPSDPGGVCDQFVRLGYRSCTTAR